MLGARQHDACAIFDAACETLDSWRRDDLIVPRSDDKDWHLNAAHERGRIDHRDRAASRGGPANGRPADAKIRSGLKDIAGPVVAEPVGRNRVAFEGIGFERAPL